MYWAVFGTAGVFLLALWLELHRRSREKWSGPNLTRQLYEWYERDAYLDEPAIKLLDLPPVKRLKGQTLERQTHVTRFKPRTERRP